MTETISSSHKRLGWIERVKGIGIILVVLGHCSRRSDPYAYLLHMPLFFILSGYLFNGKRGPAEFWKGKIFHLMVPYMAFLILLNLKPIIALAAQISHGLGSVNWPFFKKYFFDQIWGGMRLTGSKIVFWFPTVLLFAQLGYYHLNRSIPKPAVATAICVCYVLALINHYYFPMIQLPLAMNVVLGALPLFYFGVLLKQNVINSRIQMVFEIIFVAALMTIALGMRFLRIDMRVADYGFPILSFLAATGGTILCFRLTQKMRDNSYFSLGLEMVGSASMIIMYLHKAVIDIFDPLEISSSILVIPVILICVGIYWLLGRSEILSMLFMGIPVNKNSPDNRIEIRSRS